MFNLKSPVFQYSHLYLFWSLSIAEVASLAAALFCIALNGVEINIFLSLCTTHFILAIMYWVKRNYMGGLYIPWTNLTQNSVLNSWIREIRRPFSKDYLYLTHTTLQGDTLKLTFDQEVYRTTKFSLNITKRNQGDFCSSLLFDQKSLLTKEYSSPLNHLSIYHSYCLSSLIQYIIPDKGSWAECK